MKSIGKYEIRDSLGRGAMGRVYKVTVPVINKIAALKILDPSPKLVETVGMDWLKRQFIMEASIIANIRHPNVVEIWNLEETDGRPFYLMEFFCHNLGTLIRESYWADSETRIIPVRKAALVSMEILEGLFRLHQAGIVHRDIKPYNIMFTDTGTVKIADFGLSKKRGESPAADGGLFIGTRFYAAPEQIVSPDRADHRADLYSMGVMLYRMLTGRLPQTPPEPPSFLNPDLDGSWDQLILKSISPEPEDRYKNARLMGEAIQETQRAYEQQKTKECSLPEIFSEQVKTINKPGQTTLTLRSEAGRITQRRAKSVFNINTLGRPKTYLENNLEAITNHSVIDRATGLVWQRSGSDYPMDFIQAKTYINRLNDDGSDGHKHWRLPTVNEILSLLNPPPPGEDFCFDSPFSPIQKWIWSADTRSFKAAWIVNVEMGFVTSHDVMDFFYIKGVCNL